MTFLIYPQSIETWCHRAILWHFNEISPNIHNWFMPSISFLEFESRTRNIFQLKSSGREANTNMLAGSFLFHVSWIGTRFCKGLLKPKSRNPGQAAGGEESQQFIWFARTMMPTMRWRAKSAQFFPAKLSGDKGIRRLATHLIWQTWAVLSQRDGKALESWKTADGDGAAMDVWMMTLCMFAKSQGPALNIDEDGPGHGTPKNPRHVQSMQHFCGHKTLFSTMMLMMMMMLTMLWGWKRKSWPCLPARRSEWGSWLTLISCINSVSSSKLMRTDIIRDGRQRQFMFA